MGSRTLLEVSERVRGKIRKFDKLFRFGGDEFCIVLPETEWHGAMEVAERVREAISAARSSRASARRLTAAQPMTASFGIASFPLHARTKEELVAARRPRDAVGEDDDQERDRHRRAAKGSRWTRDAGPPDGAARAPPRGGRRSRSRAASSLALLFGGVPARTPRRAWSAPARAAATPEDRSANVEQDTVDAAEKLTFFDTLSGPGKEAEPGREAAGAPTAVAPPPPAASHPRARGSSRSSWAATAQAAEEVVRSLRAKGYPVRTDAVPKGGRGAFTRCGWAASRRKRRAEASADKLHKRRAKQHLGDPRRALNAPLDIVRGRGAPMLFFPRACLRPTQS